MIAAREELVDAARRGDAAALDRLIVLAQPDLARFARRVCTTGADAEDAVQVALWRMSRRIGGLRSAAAFAGWLFRIVERECHRLFHRAQGELPLDESLAASLAQAPLPLDLRRDLARAISALPAPYREVLVLRDVDELTAPETAELLGISVPAVKSRLHRARAMVRARLEEGGRRA